MSNALVKRKAELLQFIDARAKATQGEFVLHKAEDYPLVYDLPLYAGCFGIESGEESAIVYANGRLNKADAVFITQAANQAAQIAEDLLIALDAIEREMKWRTVKYCTEDGKDNLAEALARIARGGE